MNILGVYYSKTSYENSLITIDVSFTLYQLVPKIGRIFILQSLYFDNVFIQLIYQVTLNLEN